ncbi:sigma-54 interaction domain-containing protein [Brevibacillus ginsengisoli]|uniref:sigma-54 interaction domain-containing protein n=1 Tax=Brevibacillus ginsengisoli TaxID=363854 RepID=UPI003CF9749A
MNNLKELLNNHYVNNNEIPHSLFVTDRQGNILISNEFTALTLGMSLEELLRSNVGDLVKDGMYNHSFTLDAIKKGVQQKGTVVTSKGFKTTTTSTPLFGPTGEIDLVVTVGKYEMADTDVIENAKDEVTFVKEEKSEVVAESIQMKNILKACDQIAPYDCRILLYGESGTGKEVLSKYIHKKSRQNDRPFISVNCAAIPDSLFESEFFGYEKGAFTGANSQKIGLVELANNGTLFLDEISELPLEKQSKLLRVLETQEIRRVGGTEDIKVEFRVISATNKDLKQMVADGTFREDLYYRINVIPLHIPPLRERPMDIICLARKYIDEFNRKYQKNYNLNAKQYEDLLSQNWPGNVRELKNYVQRLLIVNHTHFEEKEDTSTPFDFMLDTYIKNHLDHPLSLKELLLKVEEQYIHSMIDACEGKIAEASSKLGVHRSVLYRKIKSLHDDVAMENESNLKEVCSK